MLSKSKSILFLTSHLPYPSISGGRLREFEIIKRLSLYFNIYLVVITKTYEEDIYNSRFLYEYCPKIEIFSCPNKEKCKELEGKYPSKGIRVISKEASAYILELVKNDIISLIHLESFYMFYTLPKVIVPIVLAAQNIEFDIIRQELEIKGATSELVNDFNLTKSYEIDCWRKVNRCIALTDYDYNIMSSYIDGDKITIINNGFDHLHNTTTTSSPKIHSFQKNSLIITGNYQYYPNEDAVLYFCEIILPLIRLSIEDIILYIVGNKPTRKILNLESDKIKVIGNVDNIRDYIMAADVFICPLRIGGGIKVKMLEALSCGAPIVTTHIGAQGLQNLAPTCFLTADNAEDFASHVITLLKDEVQRKRLKDSAKNIISSLNSWDDSVKRLLTVYENF